MQTVAIGMFSVVAGVLVAPLLPGSWGAWASLALGGLGLWGHRGGWLGSIGIGLLVGVVASRTVPQGPELTGWVSLRGVRVGAPQGRSGDVAVGGPGAPSIGRVRIRFRERAPPAGASVLVVGRARPVRDALPGAPSPLRAARLVGVRTEVLASRSAVIGAPMTAPSSNDPTGLLRAVTTGDRRGLDEALVGRLRRTGTAHLLAISGFHVSIVAGLAFALGLVGHRALAVRWPTGAPPWAPAGFAVLAASIYALGAGMPISAQRATLLLGLVMVGRLWGRTARILPILMFVAAAVAMVDPGALATPSFQLSFGAVAGLATFGVQLSNWIPPDVPWMVRWLGRSVVASVAATLGTLPAAAWWFQQLAPWSVVANLIAVPVTGLVIVPAAGLAQLLPEPLAGGAAHVGTLATRAVFWALAPFDVTPWAPAVGPLGAALLAGALVIAVRRPWWGFGGVAAVLLWPASEAAGWRFVFLDVGQGDAAFVQHPSGKRWLVDGGRPSFAVLQWLRRERIRHLDVVVVTHSDADHLGGTLPVIRSLSVDEVWAVNPPDALIEACTEAEVPLRRPRDALWPPNDGVPRDDNDGSIVLSLGPLLLAADIDADIEAELLDRGLSHHAWLKVAHHGSRSSTHSAFLEVVRPTHAVVSVGRDNRYGHPAPEVLDRLHSAHAEVWRTDLDGTVEVHVTPRGTVVQTSRNRAPRTRPP
ncbi:MAG: ComEC/Rec2 family competence protein [Myxococcota bacterium]